MIKSLRTITLVSALAVLPLVAGCASTPQDPSTFGGQMTNEGKALVATGQTWQMGKDKVAKGEKLISQGQSETQRGHETIRKGEQMASEGMQQMQLARQDYLARSRSIGSATSLTSLSSEIDDLQKIEKAWKRGAERHAKGEKTTASGRKMLKEGGEKMEKGHALVRDGQRLMQDAEMSYKSNQQPQ